MVVLDANILIRAVLGKRVREVIETYSSRVRFVAPDSAFAEAREHLPRILSKRKIDSAAALAVLDLLETLIGRVEVEIYGRFEASARRRLLTRDQDDWPVVAAAMAFESPIWTEDSDFFGSGMATWTTDRIELFLSEIVGPDLSTDDS
jgi:predicted nucleic acid-binding protein